MSVKLEYNTKGMPFRRLGSSGLRVPLFSLGGCKCKAMHLIEHKLIPLFQGLTLGGSVQGDPVVEIIKTAFENGINMFDTAEAYAKGESELQMCAACMHEDVPI